MQSPLEERDPGTDQSYGKESNRVKYKTSVVSIFAVLLFLLASFFIPSLHKEESIENRTMATFAMVLNPDPQSVVYRDTPVERLDAALSDQMIARGTLVNGYLSLFNASETAVSDIRRFFLGTNQHYLTAVGNYQLIDNTNYITRFPPMKPMKQEIVKLRVAQIERIHKSFPDLRIYAYYVSQAYDMPWWEGFIGAKTADHYQEILDAVPDYVKCGHLMYRDLADYMDIHYKTDHHWNHRGARRGYEDIYRMMSEDFPMGDLLMPLSENNISETYDFVYLGSFGKQLGELYHGGYDAFSFYEYDFPQDHFAVLNSDTLEEAEVVSMGIYDEYRKGKIRKETGVDHYITLYRTAVGTDGTRYTEQYPYIIRNSHGNGRNLLICGDSHNRILRDLLASNFSTLVYVDYRVLKNNPIDYLIRRYDIDTLLISSNTSMWDSKDYLFVFEEDDK